MCWVPPPTQHQLCAAPRGSRAQVCTHTGLCEEASEARRWEGPACRPDRISQSPRTPAALPDRWAIRFYQAPAQPPPPRTQLRSAAPPAPACTGKGTNGVPGSPGSWPCVQAGPLPSLKGGRADRHLSRWAALWTWQECANGMFLDQDEAAAVAAAATGVSTTPSPPRHPEQQPRRSQCLRLRLPRPGLTQLPSQAAPGDSRPATSPSSTAALAACQGDWGWLAASRVAAEAQRAAARPPSPALTYRRLPGLSPRRPSGTHSGSGGAAAPASPGGGFGAGWLGGWGGRCPGCGEERKTGR